MPRSQSHPANLRGMRWSQNEGYGEPEPAGPFVRLPDIRGIPPSGPANWTSGFLPAAHQGTSFNAAEPIQNLQWPAGLIALADDETRKFLRLINQTHQEEHPGNSDLAARVAAYELAARMQLSAPEAMNLSEGTRATRELYGADDSNPLLAAYARNCLLARPSWLDCLLVRSKMLPVRLEELREEDGRSSYAFGSGFSMFSR